MVFAQPNTVSGQGSNQWLEIQRVTVMQDLNIPGSCFVKIKHLYKSGLLARYQSSEKGCKKLTSVDWIKKRPSESTCMLFA